MTKKYFGTDGIRGKVGKPPITPEFCMHLGFAAGKVLAGTSDGRAPGQNPAVLISKDTRISGYMLESALQAGLSAAGVDVLLSGPIPTPATAYLTRALRLQAGIVISASHNPFEDNGIKFFSANGTKLPDAVEEAIEAGLDHPIEITGPTSLGKAQRLNDARGRYIEFCKSTFPTDMDLRGMRIVLDCAHGATYQVAPHVFHELGADVEVINAAPDGLNINDQCGSTHIAGLQQAVIEKRGDLGIAFDGDGDRLMMTDAEGRSYDGDQLLYVIARHKQKNGTLRGGVVGTLMSNLGFEHALASLEIPLERAKVGDRHVLEMLQANGWNLGGENSGHLLCLDRHSTGDGIISALQVLHALRARGETLNECCAPLALYPQKLINVRLQCALDWKNNAAVKGVVASAESDLRGSGRVLLRPSGTEPVIRVMVEGKNEIAVERWARRIAEAVERAAA